MSLFFKTLIEGIIQLILFSVLPLIWWLVTARKKKSFWSFIGLKKIQCAKKNNTYVWIAGVSAAFLLLSVFMLYSVRGVETAATNFSGLKLSALPAILVYAVLKTALSEEIVFRGFILKGLSAKFGFNAGNIVQSVLFGLMHGIMFFSLTSAVKTVIIILFTGGIGWFMGYINEKKADGSILPGWCIHSIANIFSGICSAFMLFG